MESVKARYLKLFFLFLVLFSLSACAQTDLVLKPVYQPAGEGRGAGGDLSFVMSVAVPARSDANSMDSVYGDLKDSNGKIQGNIVSRIAPSAFIRDALQQELVKAGYSVKVDSALPKGVVQGVVITNAVISLDEVSSLVKIEGTCKISLALELWKQGNMVRKLSYAKNISDYAVRDREKLHNQILQRTLVAVMKDAQADIVNYLGKAPAR